MSDQTLFSRKLAFITGSSLARMQARRILERDAVKCFETEAEALDWLMVDGPHATPNDMLSM
ncbi:hypothetical protein U5A82_09945 [Sphingobium sp. CR2-8]|uniref:hypothetical protein n=1 Tax=Sphingobium sp. CR2-8 TaxID=1306534 RepID=UPI002DB64E01|nr:hypothetical protein [Sphingobium sp. CR2-8]MEC3910781.1 hypothetical protein [Sphingobium sp. CR2-8]